MPEVFTSDFKQRVEALNIPIDNIIVIGSGVLDVLGIRKAGDIDLALSPSEFLRQKESGRWELRHVDANKDRRDFLTGDGVELFQGWRSLLPETNGFYEDLIPFTTEIDGIKYIQLEEIRRWKSQTGREKDLRDVVLIDRYLSKMQKII